MVFMRLLYSSKGDDRRLAVAASAENQKGPGYCSECRSDLRRQLPETVSPTANTRVAPCTVSVRAASGKIVLRLLICFCDFSHVAHVLHVVHVAPCPHQRQGSASYKPYTSLCRGENATSADLWQCYKSIEEYNPLHRGLYADQLERWFRVFDRSQVKTTHKKETRAFPPCVLLCVGRGRCNHVVYVPL